MQEVTSSKFRPTLEEVREQVDALMLLLAGGNEELSTREVYALLRPLQLSIHLLEAGD